MKYPVVTIRSATIRTIITGAHLREMNIGAHLWEMNIGAHLWGHSREEETEEVHRTGSIAGTREILQKGIIMNYVNLSKRNKFPPFSPFIFHSGYASPVMTFQPPFGISL